MLCVVHFLRYWILPSWDSLWIDETGTFWTIVGGWDQLWVRTSHHPNSRLYGILMLGWTQLAGTSEIALRLPSQAASLGAISLLGNLLRRNLGPGTGWPVAALCLASPELSFFGVDARPYAFAFLMLVISTTAWIELLQQLTWRWATAWAISAALLVHFHPVVALALLARWFGCSSRRTGST